MSKASVLTTPKMEGATPEIPVNKADIQYVGKRLKIYEKKFQRWLDLQNKKQPPPEDLAQWDDCASQFKQILSGYNGLLAKMLATDTVPLEKAPEINPSEMYRLDMTFQEGTCEQILSTDTTASPPPTYDHEGLSGATENQEALVVNLVIAGKYNDAATTYEAIVENFPDHNIPLSIKKQYAMALLQTGRMEEASAIFIEMLNALPPEAFQTSPWTQRLHIADMLLAAGNLDEAYSQYKHIVDAYNTFEESRSWAAGQITALDIIDANSPEMTAYLDLQRSFLAFDGKNRSAELLHKVNHIIRSFPDSPITNSARRIKQTVESQLKNRIEEQLALTMKLTEEKEYQQALEKLDKLSNSSLPEGLLELVKNTRDEVTLTKARELENQRRQIEESQAMQWELAVSALDSRRYDEAILYFQGLLETEYGPRAQLKISEASEIAAADNRKQSAELFIKAGRANDPEQKKEYLSTSWRLLKEITVKYPQAEIIDRVSQNLDTVEKYIKQFDPFLLQELLNESQTDEGTSSSPDANQAVQIFTH